MKIKTIFIEVRNKKEKLEDFVADNIFQKLDENDNLDKIEEIIIAVTIESISAYLTTYNLPAIPESVKKSISKAIVKGFGKANRKIQKQLKKKSDKYKKRHGKE